MSDYDRGHADGYDLGTETKDIEVEQAYEDGYNEAESDLKRMYKIEIDFLDTLFPRGSYLNHRILGDDILVQTNEKEYIVKVEEEC